MPKDSVMVRGLNAGGIEVAELWFPTGARTARLTLDEVEILFVESGELALVAASGGAPWKAGATMLRRLDVNVPLTATQAARVLTVRVPSNFRGADPDRLRPLESWMPLPDAASDDLRRLHRALSAGQLEDSLFLEALALLAVGWGERAIRQPAHDTARAPWMRVVLERLADVSRTPSLRQLGQEVGVNSAHLARAFRQAEGCTIGEYQRRLRVAAACRMLHGSTTSLSRIAIATGFTDQAHFSRIFKRQMSVTARQYRNTAATRAITPVPPQLGFDPVGTFPFRSRTADGRAYEGVLEITASGAGYAGTVRTSVMPEVALDSIAIHGRRMVLTASVPAGVAVVQLWFDGTRFTGEWRLTGRATAVRGHRAR
jgi:AraC-like DNA-binding protein